MGRGFSPRFAAGRNLAKNCRDFLGDGIRVLEWDGMFVNQFLRFACPHWELDDSVGGRSNSIPKFGLRPLYSSMNAGVSAFRVA